MRPLQAPMLLAMALLATLCAPEGLAQEPLVVVFTPGEPGFGAHLANLIQEDGRFDCRTLVLSSEDLFRSMLHFPFAKVVVVSLAEELERASWPDMKAFFDRGGGMIGLGFAGSLRSTGLAGTCAFPLFANDYKSGKYNPVRKEFTQSFVKDQPHEISEGLGDFDSPAQRLLLSMNTTTGEYLPRRPTTGKWVVLYRDSVHGAPMAVAYEGNGTSVTFATFGGEDFERSYAHYGLFASSEEFVTLFTNSLEWIWGRETRFTESSQAAREFFAQLRDSEAAAGEKALEHAEAARLRRNLQTLLTLAAAIIASFLLYWFLVARPGRGDVAPRG